MPYPFGSAGFVDVESNPPEQPEQLKQRMPRTEIERRLLAGERQADIARAAGVTQARVSQIKAELARARAVA